MTKERSLWTWLRDGTKGAPTLDMERVENGVSRGTPDVDGVYKGRSFKIELKRVTLLQNSRGNVRVDFEVMQVPWLRRRWERGGAVWVLLTVDGAGRRPRRYLVPGNLAERLENIPESDIQSLSAIDPQADAVAVLEAAIRRDR